MRLLSIVDRSPCYPHVFHTVDVNWFSIDGITDSLSLICYNPKVDGLFRSGTWETMSGYWVVLFIRRYKH